MEVANKVIEEITMPENLDKIVQMPIKIDAKTRNELKILAINKGISLNELLLGYVMEGFNKENKE